MSTVVLLMAVLFLAYANGANDNFKGVASLFGSGTTSYRIALAWATASTLAGSFCALYLAQTLLVKFSGKGLAPDELIHSIPFVTSIAGGSALTIILATRLGFPVSTTHALLGALTGGTLIATMGTINLAALTGNFILPLLLSPLLALLLAIILYILLKQLKRRMAIGKSLCICVSEEMSIAAQPAMVLQQSRGLTIHVDSRVACASRYSNWVLGINLARVFDRLHFFSAGAVCFARGLNDTPKITALLLLIPDFTLQRILLLTAVAMALGGIFNAARVAETMSHKITTLSHGQGLAANLTTALLVIFASYFGMPVSTTHVSVGALFGIGIVNRQANTRTVMPILLSWILTLPCAALCTIAIYPINAAI